MSLFQNTEELLGFIPINTNLNFERIAPSILDAEDLLQKWVGSEIFEELETAYLGSILTVDQDKLISKCRTVIANYAAANFMDVNSLDISDSGNRIEMDQNKKVAFQWQQNQAKEAFIDRAFTGLDSLLAYLEKNEEKFTTWKNSDSYTVFKQYFISSTREFELEYSIRNSHQLFVSLVPTIRRVELEYFEEVLGDQFDVIKTELKTRSLSSENKKLLEKYIRPSIANLVISEALLKNIIIINQDGVYLNQLASGGDNQVVKSQPNSSILSATIQNAHNTGRKYLERLIAYLEPAEDTEIDTSQTVYMP